MIDCITVCVAEEFERPLPWWKWYVEWYSKRFVEPIWLFHLRVFWMIKTNQLHRAPLALWYNANTDKIEIERARHIWVWRWWPYLVRSVFGKRNREILIWFGYGWNDPDPSVGYAESWPDWGIIKAEYCDTGEPYKGDLDVWNDDIGQYISDNCTGEY